jgi:DNA modification methylase
MNQQIITGDCLEILPTLPRGLARLVVTSPPYPGQKGDKRSVREWLDWYGRVLRELVPVMTGDGVLALNVMFKRTRTGWFDGRVLTEIPALLQASGLNLWDVYTWGKENPPPNGSILYNDAPAWEPVFVATKAERLRDVPFFPVREPYKRKSISRSNGKLYTTRGENVALHPEGARQSNLLLLSSSADMHNRPKAKGQSFPRKLAERFIRQHTQPGDVVLDPCAGVGTACRVAAEWGRAYLGIEIDPEEAERARAWLAEPLQQKILAADFAEL